MLPYSAQPIPLPISYKATAPPRRDPRILPPGSSNQSPSQPLPTAATRLFNKRFPKDAIRPLTSSNAAASSSPPSLLSTLPRSPSIPTAASPLSIPSPLPGAPSFRRRPSFASTRQGTSHHSSSSSSVIEDVLAPGDSIGEGLLLQGHPLTPPAVAIELQDNSSGLASELQVIRKLGTGSYAVVYLVREVLSRTTPSEDGHCGPLDLADTPSDKSYVSYGREFALKCLSKANLDEEALIAQLSEVKIHQSLPSHPNIVTLHRTLETPAFLLLILEYVPGEDLFYFLEQARDHYEPTPPVDDSTPSRTPPTPSLLASLHPTQLLSSTRLRLIARMFAQMCDAVAACHEQGVFHRDIKPENFIVTDGFVNGERRVVVKLSDFGLSTTEEDCSDMDCGSAPYMSFECRNNVAPTYKPAAADVWSLGIVLINMLYHYNPWTDTAEGVCPSFTLFRQQGTHFFMNRFTGMTSTVADFLATRVFHLPQAASWSTSFSAPSQAPVTAREFGEWVKDLPAHFDICHSTLGIGGQSRHGHNRVLSTSSTTIGHALSSCPPSRRPSSRAGLRTPILHARSLSVSRAPSISASVVGRAVGALETVMDSDIGETSMEESEGVLGDVGSTIVHATLGDQDGQESTKENDRDFLEDGRSRSTRKRGRRGARKSKNVAANEGDADETLQVLANASQTLAREISRASRSSSLANHAASDAASTAPTPTSIMPPMVKKASRWLSFGKGGNNASLPAGAEEPVPGTANNVASLIMGLAAPPSAVTPGAATASSTDVQTCSQSFVSLSSPSSTSLSSQPRPHGLRQNESSLYSGHSTHSGVSIHSTTSPYTRTPLSPQRSPADEATTWTRGRGPQGHPYNASTWGPSATNHGGYGGLHGPASGPRGTSPQSVRGGLHGVNGVLSSSASSVTTNSAKSNWRSSLSSTASSSMSAFTRYSHSSTSVSTMATSVSNGSWRAPNGSTAKQDGAGIKGGVEGIPKNIKIMSGVPRELDQFPRHHGDPMGNDHGQPSQRKARTRKPKDKLDTISERPSGPSLGVGVSVHKANTPGVVVHQRRDASTSTTDLDGIVRGNVNESLDLSAGTARSSSNVNVGANDGTTPKKVQKGQINTLAKMLSALRR
ncbi:CAMK/CAMK-unique protein kinase [Pisolithus croceorrhizus]|nr:CAMK/CAMK-unique protein kinase [Pisolithus croceorrhizus]